MNRQGYIVQGQFFVNEGIVQVHQPFDLVFGVVMFLLGLIGTGRDLYCAVRRTFPAAYADWRALCLSVFFLVDGPAHASRAFDLPHQPSPLTNTLEQFALPLMLAALLGMFAAFLVEQKGKRRRQRHV